MPLTPEKLRAVNHINKLPLQPEKLRALLVESGYTEASLGDKLPSMVMEPNQDSERLKSGVTFPTECGTVYMHDFPNMQVTQ